jgi:hypothetical protein
MSNPLFPTFSGGQGPQGPQGATGPPGIGMNITIPTVSFGTPISQSANIYIPINYPGQTAYTAIPAPVPVIAGCVFQLDTGNTGLYNNTILDTNASGSAFDSRYVRPLIFSSNSSSPGSYYINNYTGLQGIILSNTIDTNVYPTPVQFPDSKYYNSIYYNIGTLGQTASISGKYYDYSNYSTTKYISFQGYTSGSAPSADAYYELLGIPSYNGITFTVVGPSQTNTSNADGVSVNYSTIYYSTDGSSVRYPSKVSQSSTKQITFKPSTWTPNNQSKTNTDLNKLLLPNCNYTLNLSSTNNLGKTSDNTWPTTNIYTQPNFTTLFAPITYKPSSNNISSISLLSTTAISIKDKSIYSVADTSTNITNLYNSQDISTSTFNNIGLMATVSGSYDNPDTSNFYIGQNATSSTNLMSLNASLGNNYSTTINYNGFNSTPSVSGNITSTSGTIADQYTDKGLDGFYLYVNGINFTLNSNILTPSTSLNTFNLKQTYHYPSGSFDYTNSANFYYDSLGSTTINAPSITPNTNAFSTTNISGVPIIGSGYVTFTVTTGVNSFVNNFYVSNPLSYVFSDGVSGSANESNLAHASRNDVQRADWTFTNSNLKIPVNTSSAITITDKSTVTVTAYSITNGTTGVSASTYIYNILYDVPSYNFITNTSLYPSSAGAIPGAGFRIWSEPGSIQIDSNYNQITFAPPPSYDSTNQPTTYSQDWNISDANYNQELQIVNGYYQTAASGKTSYTTGYINYSTYVNSGPDYSTVSFGSTVYRFATFQWLYGGSSTKYNNFNFSIKNITYNGGQVQLSYQSSTGSYYISSNDGLNTNRFLIYCRVVNKNDSTLDGKNGTTIWADGNAGLSTNITATNITFSGDALIDNTNYSTPSNNTVVRAITARTCTISGKDLNITLGSLLFNSDSTVPMYIYCRVGFPMNANYSFEYMTLSLS